MTEFLADGPDWHPWFWTGVWFSFFSAVDEWIGSDMPELHGFDSCGWGAEEDATGLAKNVFRYTMCVQNACECTLVHLFHDAVVLSISSNGSQVPATSPPTQPNPPCVAHVLFTAAELKRFASEHTHHWTDQKQGGRDVFAIVQWLGQNGHVHIRHHPAHPALLTPWRLFVTPSRQFFQHHIYFLQ